MVSEDEARQVALRWASEVVGSAEVEVGLLPFDLGYVAWPVEPDLELTRSVPGMPPRRPANVGTPRAVIDGTTGELMQWPSLPATLIAERYAEHRAATLRFTPDVRSVLQHAGWSPGRDVSEPVHAWLSRCAPDLAGIQPSPAASAFLAEFGGLTLPQQGPQKGSAQVGGAQRGAAGRSLGGRIHPVSGVPVGFITVALATEASFDMFPVGHYDLPAGYHDDSPGELAMDGDGRLLLIYPSGCYLVGDTPDEGVTNLLYGDGYPEYPLPGPAFDDL